MTRSTHDNHYGMQQQHAMEYHDAQMSLLSGMLLDPTPPPPPVLAAAAACAAGQQQVERNTEPRWRHGVDRAIAACAEQLPGGFTADDVHRIVTLWGIDLAGMHPNSFGARFTAANKRGEIVWHGMTAASERPEAHRRLVRVWTAS